MGERTSTLRWTGGVADAARSVARRSTMRRLPLTCLVALTSGLSLSACGSSERTIAPSVTSITEMPSMTKSPSSTPEATHASKMQTKMNQQTTRSETKTSTSPTYASPSPTRSTQRATQRSTPKSTPSQKPSLTKKPTNLPTSRSPSVKPSGKAVRIDIPKIDLHHSITPLSERGSTLEPKMYEIGMFRGYGRVNPGDPGVALLAGHVTYNGPDVFYRLHRLRQNDVYTITYANGGVRRFVVTTQPESIDKDALQHDQRLWGGSKDPVVALVTCDASSGWVNSQHHSNNVVVWSKPVS